VGTSAISGVIAYSAVAWIAQENITKPLPPTPADSAISSNSDKSSSRSDPRLLQADSSDYPTTCWGRAGKPHLPHLRVGSGCGPERSMASYSSGCTPATRFRAPENELHVGELIEDDARELLQRFVAGSKRSPGRGAQQASA
jgi:hypothetical protein